MPRPRLQRVLLRDPKMTAKELQTSVERLGLEVDETIIGHVIDIVIEAPDGKCFQPGLHSLVTNWHSDWPVARDEALKDARMHLPLQECASDCECFE